MCRRNGAREGRFAAEIAGAIERTDEHLNQVQRTASLETIGMRADAAHRVEGNRATDDFVVHVAVDVSPVALYFDGFFERYVCDFCGDAANLFGGYAATGGYCFGGVIR